MLSRVKRNVVTLTEKVQGRGELGGPAVITTSEVTRRASVKGLTGMQMTSEGFDLLDTVNVFYFRYDSLTSRIGQAEIGLRFRDKNYQVLKAFDPDGKRREFIVYAKVSV